MDLQDQAATGPEHASHLSEGTCIIRVWQRQAAGHDVEAGRGKGQMLGACADERDTARWLVSREQLTPGAAYLAGNVQPHTQRSATLHERAKFLPRTAADVEDTRDG